MSTDFRIEKEIIMLLVIVQIVNVEFRNIWIWYKYLGYSKMYKHDIKVRPYKGQNGINPFWFGIAGLKVMSFF